jgi:hypothetical protein
VLEVVDDEVVVVDVELGVAIFGQGVVLYRARDWLGE